MDGPSESLAPSPSTGETGWLAVAVTASTSVASVSPTPIARG